jgi:hypothetical protein
MKQGFDKTKLLQILFPFVLLGLGYGFAMTISNWIHEGGHIIGVILTCSQIDKITLIPPWSGQVVATYHSVLAEDVFFLGGFVITFFPFLSVFILSLVKRSRLASFMPFPLFMTFASSWGDLKLVGLCITLIGAFIVGWFVPLIAFASVMGYYNIWNSRQTQLKIKAENSQLL